MEDLRVARSARQDTDDIKGEGTRPRRQPGVAVRRTPGGGGQPEDHPRAGRDDGKPAASGRRKRLGPREYRALLGPVNPMIVTLLAGLTASVVLPWAVFWLSDVLGFDIPAWSLWLIFGVPPALTFLAAMIQCAPRILGRRRMRATIPARRGR
jgi:hypothetical protein